MDVLNEITAVWSQWGGLAWNWFASSSWGMYLTSDPTGQRVALGLGLASMLVGGWLSVKFGRAVVRRCRHVPMVLLIALGAYYASVLALRLDASQWVPAAAVAAMTLLVLGLAMTAAGRFGGRGKRGRSRGGSASPKKARLATG
ncbi:MAG: hypothetical protein AAGJ38_03105 [Planctomycetota bacterium]